MPSALALIGPSAAGKSTVAALLAGHGLTPLPTWTTRCRRIASRCFDGSGPAEALAAVIAEVFRADQAGRERTSAVVGLAR